jgi:glucuronate isomerase
MTRDINSLRLNLEEALADVPVLDIHTHLVGGSLGAKGLHDILLYHMAISDLYAAGCPSGARLTQYPGWPSQNEAHARIEEAIPFLPLVRNTSNSWGVRIILGDLYDWHEPVTADNWRRLDDMIRERAGDRGYAYSVLDRLNIQRTGTEIARRGDGSDDARLEYALEWAMYTRTQWGEYDTALYELERAYGNPPQSPTPILAAEKRADTEWTIRNLADVHAAMEHYLRAIPYDQVLATATGFSTDLDYAPVDDAQMEKALANRMNAGPHERNVYASYVNELLLSGLEKRSNEIVFQFSIGAEPLPFETGGRISQHTIHQLSDMVERHSKLRFQCFTASRHANQSLCTMARELPNFSLCGYWWHCFYPDIIRQIIAERLDMVPLNKQIGFFSDAYCVEWTYAKLTMVRKQMASVLAEKVFCGQYTREDALAIARAILFETPQTNPGLTPHS